MTDLTSPRYWPGYNGKCERAIRDIKSYERAMRKSGIRGALQHRLDQTLDDLNSQRPRPVLRGRTADEAFQDKPMTLPNRKDFQIEVKILTDINTRQARSRYEKENARRKAIEAILSWYRCLITSADASTNFDAI